jgi:hypothetical protein
VTVRRRPRGSGFIAAGLVILAIWLIVSHHPATPVRTPAVHATHHTAKKAHK